MNTVFSIKGRVVILAAASLLFVSVSSRGQSPHRVTSVEKVADGVWMAKTDRGSNASWFLIGDEVIAVDTGSDVATAKEVLDKIKETAGKPVRYVVITHAHGDHAGGVGAFAEAGAQVVCQENAAGALAALLRTSSRPEASLAALSERLSFVGGPRRATIYFLGPAHTNADLLVFLPDDKILFTGDVALSGLVPYMQSPDVDPASWENILERLVRVNFDKVVPGHGPVGTRQALADTFTYVKKINEVAHNLIAEKVSDDQIEAKLREPKFGVEAAAITPEFVANVRAVMHAAPAKPAAAVAPAPSKPPVTPARKKG